MNQKSPEVLRAPVHGRQVSGRGLERLAQAVELARAHLAPLRQHSHNEHVQQQQAALRMTKSEWACKCLSSPFANLLKWSRLSLKTRGESWPCGNTQTPEASSCRRELGDSTLQAKKAHSIPASN